MTDRARILAAELVSRVPELTLEDAADTLQLTLEIASDEKRAVDLAETYANLRLAMEAQSASMTRVVNRVRNAGRTVQRRKKVSNRKGFTWDTKTRRLNRIDALERLHRKRGAKVASIKRKSEKAVMKIKAARSKKMRKTLGFDRKRK